MNIQFSERKFLTTELSNSYKEIFLENPIFPSNPNNTAYKRLEVEIRKKIDECLNNCLQNDCKIRETCKEQKEKALPYCQLEVTRLKSEQLSASARQLSELLYENSNKDSFNVGFIRALYLFLGKDRVKEVESINEKTVVVESSNQHKTEVKNSELILRSAGTLSEGVLLRNICEFLAEILKSDNGHARVAVDWVIYGIISSPKNFDTYFNHLLELSEQNRLQLLVPKMNIQLVFLEKQIAKFSKKVDGHNQNLVPISGRIAKFLEKQEVQELLHVNDSVQFHNVDNKKYILEEDFFELLFRVERSYQSKLNLGLYFLSQPIFQLMWWSTLPKSKIIISLPDFSGTEVEDRGFIFNGGFLDHYFSTIWDIYKRISQPSID